MREENAPVRPNGGISRNPEVKDTEKKSGWLCQAREVKNTNNDNDDGENHSRPKGVAHESRWNLRRWACAVEAQHDSERTSGNGAQADQRRTVA